MINKLPEKRKYVSSDNKPWTKNTSGKEDVHISAWDLRENIRSVILDWRQKSADLSSEGRDLLVPQANVSCVFSGHRSKTHKGSSTQNKYMCELSLTVFLHHTRRHRRIKVWIICLYIYEFFVVFPAVQ